MAHWGVMAIMLETKTTAAITLFSRGKFPQPYFARLWPWRHNDATKCRNRVLKRHRGNVSSPVGGEFQDVQADVPVQEVHQAAGIGIDVVGLGTRLPRRGLGNEVPD